MIRDVLILGDRGLLMRSAPVEQFDTPELHALVADLFDTLRARKGAGLAAPQIGERWRVIVFGSTEPIGGPDDPLIPETVLVNPVVTPLTDEIVLDTESCLSVPGVNGAVPRYRRVRYAGFDPYGNPVEREVEGFHARVVQHECDHLDGLLFPARVYLHLVGQRQGEALAAAVAGSGAPAPVLPGQAPSINAG